MKPYKFQETGIDFMLKTGRAILADDMGVGKTIQTIECIKRARSRRILIVCPKSLTRNWCREIEVWYGGAPVTILEGNLKQVEKLLLDYKEGFLITNYEKIRPNPETIHYTTKFGNPAKTVLERNPLLGLSSKRIWDTVIFDEAHRLKNRKAQQTLGAFSLGKSCKRCYHLTGTPVQNRMGEIWSLLHILYPKEYSSFWRFMKDYAGAYQDVTGVWVCSDKPINPAKFQKEVLSPIFLRRLKEDVLPDLPEKTHQRVYVRLEGRQRKLYEEMEEEFIATFVKTMEEIKKTGETHTEQVVAFNALSQMLRLKQICVAPSIMTENTTQIFPSAKIERLIELFQDSDEKIVVFSQFETAIRYASERLKEEGIGHVQYTGKVNTKERDANVTQYLTDPKCRGFLATIKAGGEGLNLVVGSTCVFLDKDWTPAANDQAAARLHRNGQKNAVMVYEFYAEDTVEEYIEELLGKKDAIIEAVTGFANRRKFV